VVPVPCTKKNGKPNFDVEHHYNDGKWNTNVKAYLQGYPQASYVDFAPYMPNITLESIKEGGSSHQAHPPLRHIADTYHACAWGDFHKMV